MPTADGAHTHRGIRRIEPPGRVARLEEIVADPVDLAHQLRSAHHRVGAQGRLGGMRLEAVYDSGVDRCALVSIRDLQPGRFPHDHGPGARQAHAELRDRVEDAQTGDLLVIGEDEMHRLFQPGGAPLWADQRTAFRAANPSFDGRSRPIRPLPPGDRRTEAGRWS